MTHTLPSLPYAFDALEPYIDAKTMEIHHDKHHAGYVKKLNTALEDYPDLKSIPVEKLIKNLKDIPKEINWAVRNNGGGHVNHSFFWQILRKGKENNNPEENSEIASAIEKSFESFDKFKERFTHAATTHFGSGWAWLVINENGQLEVISSANQDNPLAVGKTPILGLDVWEHAYYLKYQNKRPEYIDAFFSVINWDKVEENLKEAEK